jgi:hypothetical protein
MVIGKASTCHTERRKNKKEDGRGGGVEPVSDG